MSSRRVLSMLGIAATVCFGLAPAAGAYKIPGAPGSPGGPPTKAKGGTGTSKGATNKVAVALAGFTGAELAAHGSFTVKVHFPKAGTIMCDATTGGTPLGSGQASDGHAGNKHLTLTFSSSGEAFLNSHNGEALPVRVSCTFTPKKGSSSTSHARVLLDA